MDIAVLGTGSAGRTIAARLAELGHHVTIGTRDPEETAAREDFGEWAPSAPDVTLGTFEDAAAAAELIFLVTNGGAALDVLDLAGAGNVAGKVLVDVSNPLDFSRGFPPTLFVKDEDSLAERVQRAHPDARVVKSLSTMNASVMVRPADLGESTSVFVSGNDADAKAAVSALLESFGHDDVIDLGDITTARGAEMYLPLWLRLMGGLGTASFNIKVVR
jgi:8-hydroxy-5-deazaflavin:NADPH oxidoreductase